LACGAQISCAIQSYGGEVSIPSFFTDRSQVEEFKNTVTDSLSAEEAMWRDGSLSKSKALPAQKEWFEKALATSLRERGIREFKQVEKPLKITATALSDFVKCPFRWYCAYDLGIEETDYQADMVDNLEVGNLLHDCLEQWLKEVGDLWKLKSEDSLNKLNRIFAKRLEQYRSYEKAAYLPRQERILLHYPQVLLQFADVPFKPGMRLKSVEKSFDETFDGYRMKGRIDCILEYPNGDCVVIDFKKKNVDKKSEQIQLYAKIMDKVMDKRPVMGAYYSIEKGKLEVIWETAEELNLQLEELDSVIERLKKAVEESDLQPTPSDENCEGCKFRSICRTRYVIK
ncbi:MAG: RecB family exonuclease, partial [Spirochaetales bacterium]